MGRIDCKRAEINGRNFNWEEQSLLALVIIVQQSIAVEM